MPPKTLNPDQKAVASRLTEMIEALKMRDLRAEIEPLREYFKTAKDNSITTRAMATEIVQVHPKFKGQSINAIVAMIDDITAGKKGTDGEHPGSGE